MTYKKLKENKIFRIVSNKYFLISLLFVVWMTFFDENSFFTHRELDKEIDKLESSIDYYQNEIQTDRKIINNLKNPDSLEKFAREEYLMKRKGEVIYLMEFDTIER